MEEELFKDLITLYLIKNFDHFKSGYNLLKVLSRKFGIFQFSDTINSLLEKVAIIKEVRMQFCYYTITTQGEAYLQKNLDQLRQELINVYLPNEKEYIEKILSLSQ